MDSFVSVHTSAEYEGALGINTMGYYNKGDIPFYYDLAKKFTICDNYFCSVLGPTHPNRLMATDRNTRPGRRGRGTHPRYRLRPDHHPGHLLVVTMPEALQSAGISWKAYNPYGSDLPARARPCSSARTCCSTSSSSQADPDLVALPERLRLLRAQRQRRPDLGHQPQRLRQGRGQQHPSPGVVDHVPRLLRRAPAGTGGTGRVVHPADPRHAAVQPDGLGQHGAVHHVRRERRLLRPRPPAGTTAGHHRRVSDRRSAAGRRRRRSPVRWAWGSGCRCWWSRPSRPGADVCSDVFDHTSSSASSRPCST